MCFHDESDWHAEDWRDVAGEAGPATLCDECNARIRADEWRRTIHGREHAECVLCNDDDPDCEHEFGLQIDYVRCRACDQILAAIEAVESEEGCPPHARRPALTELREALIDHEQADVYRRRARMLFPTLVGNRLLREEDVA